MQSAISTDTGLRILIIGNSGSDKSWLATRLARKHGIPHINLDDLYFVGGGYRQTRTKEETIDLALVNAQQTYHALLVRTTHLIWLTPPKQECLSNIVSRGNRDGASSESFLYLSE